MRKVKSVIDFNGEDLHKGDTVSTLTDGVSARVCDLAVDGDDRTPFVCLRPLHSPFSKGVWHAAEHVQFVSAAKK